MRSDERPSNLEALEDADPCVLDDLVGDGVGGHEHPRDASHRGAERVDEFHERGLVAGAQSLHERQVGVGARTASTAERLYGAAQPGRTAPYGVS